MTTLQLRRLCHLVEKEGWSVGKAARAVGVSPSWARRCLRAAGLRARRPKTLYAAYDRETTALVVLGTAQDLSRALRLSPATIRAYASTGKGRLHIIRLDEKGYEI